MRHLNCLSAVASPLQNVQTCRCIDDEVQSFFWRRRLQGAANTSRARLSRPDAGLQIRQLQFHLAGLTSVTHTGEAGTCDLIWRGMCARCADTVAVGCAGTATATSHDVCTHDAASGRGGADTCHAGSRPPKPYFVNVRVLRRRGGGSNKAAFANANLSCAPAGGARAGDMPTMRVAVGRGPCAGVQPREPAGRLPQRVLKDGRYAAAVAAARWCVRMLATRAYFVGRGQYRLEEPVLMRSWPHEGKSVTRGTAKVS